MILQLCCTPSCGKFEKVLKPGNFTGVLVGAYNRDEDFDRSPNFQPCGALWRPFVSSEPR